MVKESASRVEDHGFESRLHRDFSGSSHTSDLKIDTPVATLPGVWRYRVSAGTGRHGVSMLSLGEVESLIRSFYLGVAARKNCLSRFVPEIHSHVQSFQPPYHFIVLPRAFHSSVFFLGGGGGGGFIS